MEKNIIPEFSSALYLLLVEWHCFLLIGIAALACGLVLNFRNDFDNEQVNIEHECTEYWVGIVLVITVFLAIAAATAQRKRWVLATAMFLFLVSILVSLFAVVAEENDWIQHNNAARRKGFWESEDYECNLPLSTSCVCTNTSNVKWISTKFDCKTLEFLDYLYGSLIGCIMAGIFLALSSISVVLLFIPIRRLTVTVVHPITAKPASIIKVGFIANPNFTAQYVCHEPPSVRYVRHQEQEQVHYVQKPRVVYVPRPRVAQKRALVPVRRSGTRPQERTAVCTKHPPPSYIVEGPGPAWYVCYEPPPVRYVRRQEQEQVRYVQKPRVVYVSRPFVAQKRVLVPVRRPGRRPQETKHPRPSYIVKGPGRRPLIVGHFSLVFGTDRPTLR